jgi:acetylornithine deacetylase/succinyl-diaminopimelate desuccinylase family protein
LIKMRNFEEVLRNLKEERILETLQSLVRIPSINPPGNEKPCSEFIKKLLESHGIEVELQEVLPNRANVLARIEGKGGGPRLLLDGHMDVVPVPEGERWLCDPFSGELKGEKLYGRGSADAKGSLAAMLEAFIAIKKSGLEPRGDLILLATVGEERGHIGVQEAIKRGLKADMAVVGEPTGLKVCIADKGVSRIELTTLGRAAHAGRPWLGINAIYKMARLVLRLEDYDEGILRKREHPLMGHPSLAVTIINGGIQRNMVPDACKVHVDRRIIPGEELEDVKAEIVSIVKELEAKDPDFKARIEFVYDNPAAETSSEEPIVALSREAVRSVCGFDPAPSGFEANCEMSDLVGYAGIPTVVFGPGNLELAHAANEYVEVCDVLKAARVYATIALKACF